MKKLLLVLAIPALFSCQKHDVIPPQTTKTVNQPSTTSPFANCGKDSSWTRSHPKTTSLYYFQETCTHITITFAVTKQKVTILKPTDIKNESEMTNYKDRSVFSNSTDPNKFYYSVRCASNLRQIIYDAEEANSIGVGGAGMLIK